ncbi:uncharacterized protein LOC119173685 isoform X2 [Rhipicephalus microplus]|uniref:uncharacterized protein LOC119173685 isoform X2 n=1 Tax=Rhipicephalus microplus TaxID=6941 RepID=UPI003F6C0383
MDTSVTVPAAGSKSVFVAFASCSLLVVIMLFLSTLALVKLGTFSRSSDHAGVHSAAKAHGVAAQIQDLVTPEDSFTNQVTPVDHRGAAVPHSPHRGRFPLLPAELYTNASHQYFCFYQPREYQGAVLLWKVSLETLAARRGYSELLERVSRRFSREGFVFSVLVDTGDSLNQRLNLGELDAALPSSNLHSTASIMLYPIVSEPPVALSQGVQDSRSAVLYEKSRLREALKQLQSTLTQDPEPLSPSLGGSGHSGRPAGVSQSAASKLCYVISFSGVTYKFWDSNVTGVQEVVYGPGDPGPITKTPGELAYYEICNEVWDSSQVFEFGVVSKQGANWVSHLTEFVVPPLARYLRDQFGARCFGVWNLWHDDFAGVCGGGQYPLMRNLFGVFSDRR